MIILYITLISIFQCLTINNNRDFKLTRKIHNHLKKMSLLTNEQTTSSTSHLIKNETFYVYHTCLSESLNHSFVHHLQTLTKILNIEHHTFDPLTKPKLTYGTDILELEGMVSESDNFQTNLMFTMFIFNLKTSEGANLLDYYLDKFLLADVRMLESIFTTVDNIIDDIKSVFNTVFFCLRTQKKILAAEILAVRHVLVHHMQRTKLLEGKSPFAPLSNTDIIIKEMAEIEGSVKDVNLLELDTSEVFGKFDDFKKLENLKSEYNNQSQFLLFENDTDLFEIDKEVMLEKVLNGKTYGSFKSLDINGREKLLQKIYAKHKKDLKFTFDVNSINTSIEMQKMQDKVFETIKYVKFSFAEQAQTKLKDITKKSYQVGVLENIVNEWEKLSKILDKFLDIENAK